jgi:hypothetical protein
LLSVSIGPDRVPFPLPRPGISVTSFLGTSLFIPNRASDLASTLEANTSSSKRRAVPYSIKDTEEDYESEQIQ